MNIRSWVQIKALEYFNCSNLCFFEELLDLSPGLNETCHVLQTKIQSSVPIVNKIWRRKCRFVHYRGRSMDSESETESDDVIEINTEVVKEQKKQKQSQITAFFRSHK